MWFFVLFLFWVLYITSTETRFSEAEEFDKKQQLGLCSWLTLEMQEAIYIVGGPKNQGWRERTALLLDSSAQIQHRSWTSGEHRMSHVEADPPADNGPDGICWRLQALQSKATRNSNQPQHTTTTQTSHKRNPSAPIEASFLANITANKCWAG